MMRLLAFACAIALVGCARDSTPAEVSGKVSYDGKVIEEGHITFTPIDGTVGQERGGPIAGGAYWLQGPDRLHLGTYQVCVRNLVARQVNMPGFPEPVSAMVNTLPAAYNTKSKLTICIDAATPRNFDFDLTKVEEEPESDEGKEVLIRKPKE